MPDSSPVVLLNKQAGVSSFRALGPLKRRTGIRKVGHAGTLDPFAEGLLIALCGRSTRLAPLFSGLPKRYRVRIRFGVGTNTLDPEGYTTGTGPWPDRMALEGAAAELTGEIDQVPPGFSAVRVGGKRAYKLARRGESVTIEPRKVRIETLNLETYKPPVALFDVRCSKGTYVRAIARDLASALGTYAYVEWLRRTEIGPFSLEEAVAEPVELDPAEAIGRLQSIPLVRAVGETAKRITKGGTIDPRELHPEPEDNGIFGVLDEQGKLIAIMKHDEGWWRYQTVLATGD